MKKKPNRKNFHKERIFTLEQNKFDFDYIKEHRGKIKMVEKKAYELYEKHGCQHGRDSEDWFEAEKLVEDELRSGKGGLCTEKI